MNKIQDIIPVLYATHKNNTELRNYDDHKSHYYTIFSDDAHNVYVLYEMVLHDFGSNKIPSQIIKIYDFNIHNRFIKKITRTNHYIFVLTSCNILYLCKTYTDFNCRIKVIDDICTTTNAVQYATNIKNIYTGKYMYVTVDMDNIFIFQGLDSDRYPSILAKHLDNYKNAKIKEIYFCFCDSTLTNKGIFIVDDDFNVYFYSFREYKYIFKNVSHFYSDDKYIIFVDTMKKICVGEYNSDYGFKIKVVSNLLDSDVVSVFCDEYTMYWETRDGIHTRHFHCPKITKIENFHFNRHEINHPISVKSARKIID